jgi:hydroxymethylpyrimidine pyrophosphatase-like HAD family hydrolase
VLSSQQPLVTVDPKALRNVRFVFTEMDETLTHHGRLAARTYAALERLQNAGIKASAAAGGNERALHGQPG